MICAAHPRDCQLAAGKPASIIHAADCNVSLEHNQLNKHGVYSIVFSSNANPHLYLVLLFLEFWPFLLHSQLVFCEFTGCFVIFTDIYAFLELLLSGTYVNVS